MSEAQLLPVPADKAPGRKKNRTVRWQLLRAVVQGIVLILFIYFLLRAQQHGSPLFYNFNHIFFNLDPLAGIASMIASRSFIPGMLWGLFVLGFAVLLGRAWCGWLCPMGTVLDWVPSRRSSRGERDIPSYWRQVKYLVLLVIIVMALFGSLMFMFLDPITLLVRTLAGAVLPGLNYLISGLQSLLYGVEPLRPAVTAIDGWLRPWILNEQAFYLPNIILLVFFAAVLALNAVRARFWCRYLCPLGGLLALVSRVSLFRLAVDKLACTACGRCAPVCPTGAIVAEKKFDVATPECTLCLGCVEKCNSGAYKLKGLPSAEKITAYDPSRRQFFFTLGAGIAGGLLLRFVPVVLGKVRGYIRPPGATDASIENSCIRCGECVRVCPTGVIQPASSVAAWDELWTPRLVMRHGYCDYSCNYCGQICPTGAIAPLSLEQKRQEVIGTALIDESRCIPYADGIDCGVCEEMCPVPGKAIKFTVESVTSIYGDITKVHLPVVNRNHCIGCGICETRCPVNGESAIRVFTVNGETSGQRQGQGQGLGRGRNR